MAMESLDLGYAEERFNEVVNEDLHCPICTNVLKQPVHCGTNEHYFCKVCITRHLENNQNCPCCMEGLVIKDLKPPSRFVTNRLSTLVIRCDNSDQGCQELVKLEDLSSHVKNCEFSPVVCSNDGCSLIINKKDQEHHELVACQFRKTECTACSELRNDLEEMKANIKEVKAQLSEMESVKEFFYPMTVEVLDNMKNVEEAFGRLMASDSVRENIIILGGCGKANSPLNSVELFNWSTRSWELLKPMYRSLGKSSAVVYKDQVIVSGGLASFPANSHPHAEITDSMETISLGSLTKAVSGKWSKFPVTMPEKRSAHKCVIYKDRLIVIGGFDNKKGKLADGIDEVLLTSPHTTKSIVSRMPCRRRYHGADLFGDKIVIAGGTSSGNMFECLDSVLEYDVNTTRHRDLHPLPFAVTGMATVGWRGKVVLIGGIDNNANRLDTVVMYNPKTGKSTMLPSMEHKREGCSAIVTGNVIVVMGGHNNSEGCLNSVEYFSFDSYSWEELPAMNVQRAYASTVLNSIS